jgi:hypothetical protein
MLAIFSNEKELAENMRNLSVFLNSLISNALILYGYFLASV